MFARFFAADPLKKMNSDLSNESPDPRVWKDVSAYLVRGSQPRDNKAKEVIRAYLDLRDSLGGLAIFRNNAELTHQALAEPCRKFFISYEKCQSMAHAQLMTWARFCLAADHLLAVAYEARLEKGEARKRRMGSIAQYFAKVKSDYFKPLRREGQRPRDLAEVASGEFERVEPAGVRSAQAA